MKRYQKYPTLKKKLSDAGIFKVVRAKNLRNIVCQLCRRSGQSSKSIFTAAGHPDVSKSTRNAIPVIIGLVKDLLKIPPLTPKHRSLRMEWTRKYLNLEMSHFLFTDETRGILNGSDSWANGWLYFRDECHYYFRHEQQGGGVMV